MSDILRDFDKKNEFPKVKIPKFATGGICNDAIFPKLDAFSQIDEIVKDVRDRQDNAMAMEFTKCIGELLKKNGVTPKITEYTHENVKEHSIEQLYGVTIDELDFSAHDKVFEDKIASLEKQIERLMREKQLAYDRSEQLMKTADILNSANKELKQRISELESMETETLSDIDTSNPLACAESLIEHMTHCEKFMIMPERDVQTFSVEELKEIADYLMVYYKHHKDRDAEDTISF